jgi:hypothetical protein
MEWYYKRKDYLDNNSSMGFGKTEQDIQDEEFYGLEYSLESVLPNFAEPTSCIKFEDNKDMYRFLTKEMRGHFNKLQNTITDAMEKTDKEFPTAYHTTERNMAIVKGIEESLKDKSFADDNTKRKTIISLFHQKQAEEDEALKAYIQQRVLTQQQPYRDVRLWRTQRIAELQDEIAKQQAELRRLSLLQENVKQIEAQDSGQEQTQNNPGISQ